MPRIACSSPKKKKLNYHSNYHSIYPMLGALDMQTFQGSIAVMARHGTLPRRPAKEQPPADMRDDKTAITTADHTHIPLPSLAPSIPCPDSDRCDTAGVPVPPLRRSAPAISRFCPVLGWRTMLQLLARRAAESYAFTIPDHNALWTGQRMTSSCKL